ncbi:TolC family protein [Nostoc sp. TCL26-01]|uniref:TolC family protein n=1 Tax=Nostoc sp. TCL26-01 TaxID=2576904 RepID=UPI0015B84F58|nr:TolC family protein [Nostoc sp. TCL26-01]QLE59000.1 TolC family protein [Nostoc sp. TCL26-01]
MKGQYLLYSFLPSVTAAVLTTQPAVAEAMKVNSEQLVSESNVLAIGDRLRPTVGHRPILAVDKNETQLPNNKAQIFPDSIANSGLTTLDSPISSNHSHPVISTASTGINGEQKPLKDEGIISHQTPNRHLVQRLKQKRFTSNQKPINQVISQQKLATSVVSNTSKHPASKKQTFSLSYLQSPLTSPENLKTQLPTAVGNVNSAKLLGIKSCSPQTCFISNRIESQLAQNPTPENSTPVPTEAPTNTQPTTPVPTEAPANTQPTTPVPTEAPTNTQPTTPVPTEAPANTQPTTVTPTPASAVEVPQNLIPNANPLQFPTDPEEVTLKENQPITLVQTLELARRNNRDLQVTVLELKRSQEALREAQAALFPTLNVISDITRSQTASDQLRDELSRRNGVPSNTDEPSTSFTGQAELSYDLYTSGRRNATIKEAEEQVKFNELAVERQSEEIRLTVTTAYYDLQQADEQVRIARSAVEQAQASLRDAQALERAGVGTRFDVLRSQVSLANNTQQLTNSISQQQTARRNLASLLSLPQSVNISAADPVQLAGLWNQSLEQSIILAYQNRPELQQQLAQRNISEQQRRQALSNLGPQVSLIANYNLLDQFDDKVAVTDGYSLGVRATLNLFDGGASRARASQAKTNIAIAETNFANQRNQVRFQVEQAFSTQKANLENVQTANVALEQAREALRLARLRFQAGVGTQTDVINSENDLTQAEGNRITAILDYNRALAQLQRAVTSRGLR